MSSRRPMCLVCIIFLIGIYAYTGTTVPGIQWPADELAGSTVAVSGTVADRQQKADTYQIYLKNITFHWQNLSADKTDLPEKSSGIVIKLGTGAAGTEHVKIGSLVEAEGVFMPFDRARCEGMFDTRSYYMIRGYEGQLKRAKITSVSKKYSVIPEHLRRLRERACGILKDNMDEEDASVVAAMTLGDKTGLDTQIKDLYQNAGISHILALSGLHIASVGLALLALLKKMRIPPAAAAVTAFLAIALYAVMTGMSTSTVRAMIMFGLYVVSGIPGRTYDILSAAALSAVLILIFNYRYIYDTGFLLSFGAIVGIVFIYPVLASLPSGTGIGTDKGAGIGTDKGVGIGTDKGVGIITDKGADTVAGMGTDIGKNKGAGMGKNKGADMGTDTVADMGTDTGADTGTDTGQGRKKRKPGIVRKVYQSLCISVSVTLATLPVTGKSFMQISLCSVFINLLVIPLMSIVLLTGFTGIITGVMGIKPYVILKITHYILALYRALAETSEKIDGNTFVIGTPATLQIITYAIIVTIVVIKGNSTWNGKQKNNTVKISVDRTGRHFSKNNKSNRKKSENKITYITEKLSERKKKTRKNILNVIITIAMLALSISIFTFHPRSSLEIRNVDVGQGDCALIWGKDVPVIMVDGGSSDVKQVGKYRIAPVLKSNRITTVDFCFLTHMDSDHVNGVIEMLEDDACPICFGTIFVSDMVLDAAMHEEKGEGSGNIKNLLSAARRRGVKIAGISAGDIMKTKKLKITCISPQKTGIIATGGKVNSTDENDCSLVLSVEYKESAHQKGFSALFTGDISENTEEGILHLISDCDYLKVAHHGSRYSTSSGFLKRSLPEICVISAGNGNRYGHPHAETLKRLSGITSRIFCTTDTGEVIFKIGKKGVSAETILSE